MSQPVKLSDELVLDARVTAASAERSIAGQIEYWAQLGRAIEPLLRGDTARALRQSHAERSLSGAIRQVDTGTGRERVAQYLKSRPFPHFEPDPDSNGLLVKIDEDGTRTRGRFVNRVFEEASSDA